MAAQLKETARRCGSLGRTVNRTPQARRFLEGPVLATLLRLAAPTVALMLLQGVRAAGEAAFVGRLGTDALAGVSPGFPVVMFMTTLSAGAYGGAVASGVARALAAGRSEDAARLAGTALGMSALLGLAWTAAMRRFGRTVYAALGATGPAQEVYSSMQRSVILDRFSEYNNRPIDDVCLWAGAIRHHINHCTRPG